MVWRKRKDCAMQLIRVFAGHIFQNCFDFKKGSCETSLLACMFAWKRVKRLERLPLSCVSFWHICQNVANTFYETFGNTLLLQPSHIHSINDTFRVPSHELFIAQKKRCREVNRQGNTNNILLTLLFTIKRCLSISLKRSV